MTPDDHYCGDNDDGRYDDNDGEIMITATMKMTMTMAMMMMVTMTMMMPVIAQSGQIPSFFYLQRAAQGTCDHDDHCDDD